MLKIKTTKEKYNIFLNGIAIQIVISILGTIVSLCIPFPYYLNPFVPYIVLFFIELGLLAYFEILKLEEWRDQKDKETTT